MLAVRVRRPRLARAAGGVLRCAEPTGQLPLSLGARSGCCLRLSSAYTCARAPC